MSTTNSNREHHRDRGLDAYDAFCTIGGDA
jgi:hypothetical protein